MPANSKMAMTTTAKVPSAARTTGRVTTSGDSSSSRPGASSAMRRAPELRKAQICLAHQKRDRQADRNETQPGRHERARTERRDHQIGVIQRQPEQHARAYGLELGAVVAHARQQQSHNRDDGSEDEGAYSDG